MTCPSELTCLLPRPSSESIKQETHRNLKGCSLMQGVYRLGRRDVVQLHLTQEGLCWTSLKNSKPERRIPLNEILAVQQETLHRRCSESLHCLCVHSFKRRKKRPNVWIPIQLKFIHESMETVQEWKQALEIMLNAIRERPKRLWVFINPFGGAKTALKIWKHKVSPLFTLAGIETEIHVTQAANGAYDMIQSIDVSQLHSFDGIVVVGGDGLFQEVMNGLFHRHDLSHHSMRMGHVPAGSTDAVAWSVNGSRCVVSAVLRVILGDRLGVDVMHIESNVQGQQRYAACLAGYGFMADVISLSDRLRCLGPVRYDVAGVMTFLAHRKQKARISYVRSRSLDMHGECRTASLECQEKKESSIDQIETVGPSEERIETIEGVFVSIIIAVIPCRSDKSPNGLIPRARLSDGQLHITLVQDCPRWRHLSFLLSIARHGVIPGEHDFVHSIDAEWVRVEPIDGTSIWSIDGEAMHDQIITSQVLHSRMEVFARGVESNSKEGRSEI